MASKDPLNPVTTRLEFLGVLGGTIFLFAVPAITIVLQLLTLTAPEIYLDFAAIRVDQLISLDAILAIFGWYLFHIVLYIIVPGAWASGSQLRNGEILKYKINGFQNMLITAATVYAVCNYHAEYLPGVFRSPGKLEPLLWISRNVPQLAVGAIILAYLQSIFLYAYSFRPNTLLALGGHSKFGIYNFFIGRELNPRIGSFDFKYFCELRPGLVGWALLNTAYLAKLYSENRVVNSAVLVWALQLLYVADALFFERSILSTMDITSGGFGFMLNVGNLAWVPFTYSLQLRYLSLHPLELSPGYLAAVLLLQILGFYTFRAANSQKDAFRRLAPELKKDKNPRGYTWIETKTGSLLLTNGWWGRARHINSLGDWLMALSWCLPCGFENPVPYFYAAYFAGLLIHRERRDDHKCHEKYGEDWDRYTKLVPSRIVPGIY